MTFSRRPGARNNRGRIATAASASAPATPITIFGSSLIEWWTPDAGNTIAADGNWVGRKAGLVLAQAAGASRPTQFASGGPNNKAYMELDGTDDWMNVALVRAAPLTTPSSVLLIMRQDTWTLNDAICNDDAGSFALFQRTASPVIAQSAGTATNNNNGLAVGSWGLVQGYFSGSVSDSVLCIANEITGNNSGNTAGTGFRIGTNSGGTTFGDFSVRHIILVTSKPAGAVKTDLDAWITSDCGSGLV